MVVEVEEATDDVTVRLREQLMETAAQLEQSRTRHKLVMTSQDSFINSVFDYVCLFFRLDVTELKNRVHLLTSRPPTSSTTTDPNAPAHAEQEAGDSDVNTSVTSPNANDAQYVERELLLLQETIMTLKVCFY